MGRFIICASAKYHAFFQNGRNTLSTRRRNAAKTLLKSGLEMVKEATQFHDEDD
jgi:hypothetical protein